MVSTSLSAHHDTRIVARRRNHAKHFARRWLNGYNTTYLAFEQTLSQFLQLDIDTQREVFACNGPTVELSILIVALYTSVGIAQKNLHTLFATKLLLVTTFYTQLASVIARLIVVGVLHIALRNLGHITQNVSSVWILVLSDASFLHIETRKTENLLLENAELLIRKLAHEHLFGEARITWIFVAVLDIVHPFDEILLGNAQGVAKLHCV